MNFALTTKVFCDGCSRKVVSYMTCQAQFHKLYTSINNKQYQKISKENILYMCLQCQSNLFPVFDQWNSDVSLINFGFNNFRFSSDTDIFPDENLKSFFTKCNSIEAPFNDFDHPVFINSSYLDINYFNKLNINKN